MQGDAAVSQVVVAYGSVVFGALDGEYGHGGRPPVKRKMPPTEKQEAQSE